MNVLKLIFLILSALGVIFTVAAFITKLSNQLLLGWVFVGFATLPLITGAILRWWKWARLYRAVNRANEAGAKVLQAISQDQGYNYTELTSILSEFESAKLQSAELKLQDWEREAWSRLILSGLLLSLPFIATISYEKYQSNCFNRISPGAALEACNFKGQDLSGTELHDANLEGAILSNAILRQADLSDANLSDANLRYADLSGATLLGANLEGAILSNAILRQADLSDANLSDANLRYADLSGATLDVAVLDVDDLQGAIGLTDDILAKILNVTDDMLSSALSQGNFRLESREAILQELKDVCLWMGVIEAGTYAPDKSFHALVLLNAQGEEHKFTGRIPDEWEPMAIRFSELVVCAEEEEEISVEKCIYSGGPPIEGYQNKMHVRLMAAKTGDVVAERTFLGTKPRECPAVAPSNQTRIEGGHVAFKDIELFLEEYINPPQP
jgi:uncharacterized protein YjbI with pentapeptide repeats